MNFKRQNQKLNSYIPISEKEPLSVITEQYRKLRTNIELSSFNHEIKTVAITSTMAAEGKTLTAVNLATVYAQSGLKTLLIDMDLRKPKVHRGFGLINEIGLADIITKKMDYDKAVHVVNPNLNILTAGSKLPFPAEFLMSEKLKDLVIELKGKYERIIIDTPPMTAVTDASIISTFVDGVIIVIANRQTRLDIAERAIKDLKDHGANIIGSVLTRVDKREQHYLNYYSYYHDSEDKKK